MTTPNNQSEAINEIVNYRPLMERLKPEILAIMQKEQEEFPCVVGNVFDQLKTNIVVINLSYGIALDLMCYYRKAYNKHCDYCWECFIEESQN